MVLVKEALPVPSLVILSATVGAAWVAQQTPFFVMADPPSSVIVPPVFTLVDVASVMLVVV
jgi:hypothetical protein